MKCIYAVGYKCLVGLVLHLVETDFGKIAFDAKTVQNDSAKHSSMDTPNLDHIAKCLLHDHLSEQKSRDLSDKIDVDILFLRDESMLNILDLNIVVTHYFH